MSSASAQMVFQEPPENFNPRVEVAACFMEVNGKFLFMKRQPHKSEGNLWGIPGGKCEKGEHSEITVIREIKEETGVDLPKESLKYFGKVYIRYPEVDFVYHMYAHDMESYPTEIAMDPNEHFEYRWMTLKEALELPLIRGEDECIYLVYGKNP